MPMTDSRTTPPLVNLSPAIDPNALQPAELWSRLIDDRWLCQLIDAAKAEDLGEAGDITTELTIDAERTARATVRSRTDGVLAGAVLLGLIAKRYDERLAVRDVCPDGSRIKADQTLAVIEGPLRSLLAAERVMLNFLTPLSGIATLTGAYVAKVAKTETRIYDTRKTLPGWRALAKYAVRCGGGCCHRLGLHDAVLIKDNHLAHLPAEAWRDHLTHAVEQALQREPRPRFIEVEVDTLDQLDQVLGTGVDVVLLDNFTVEQLRQAVQRRDERAANVQLEASGGVNLGTVTDLAATGVDRIAVGALTHSAPALDIGLDIEPAGEGTDHGNDNA